VTDETATAGPLAGRTAWARSLETPLRAFLRTETGGAAVLLGAAVAALAWVNIHQASYTAVWGARLSVRLAGPGVSMDLRDWVNSGLMTFFFFVVGLEARREFDLGQLRERRRLALPVLAGLGGMAVPVVIYLAVNAGGPGERGWGTAMSTDTAFALGLLALTGSRFPGRVRVFLLSVSVVDDLASLVVIGTAYSQAIRMVALAAGAGLLAVTVILRRLRIRYGLAYAALGLAAWFALLKSGIDPVVTGLVMGLVTYASTPARTDLERASDLFRSFREQPTPELARSAGVGLAAALSPNERLQQLFHPWTSYVIVPLFALANAGIVLSGGFLAHAYASPVTLGIIIGYLAGKPAGIMAASWLLTKASRGRLRPPVGWAAVTGVGSIAGIGFAVSILIATLAFAGWSSGPPPCCRPGPRSAPCWAPRRPSSTSPSRSTRTGITSAGRTRPWSPSSSTATSSAHTAARLSPCCASCWPGTATSATSGATCPSPMSTPPPSSPPRRPRRPPTRMRSGTCMTCCSPTRTR
jgi:Na+/H+ antiporter NhaA